MTRTQEDHDKDMTLLILLLEKELGRLPTEDEVFEFIFGDAQTRVTILCGGYE